MAGGAGSSTARARAGKFKKPTRGGGKHFSRNLQPLDADGNAVSIWAEDAKKKGSDSDEDSEEDSSEESEDEGTATAAKEDASRADRKAEKKARKEAAIARNRGTTVEVGDMPSSDEESSEDDDMPANPNHSKAARNQAKAPVNPVEEITEGVAKLAPSRKEREAIEAAAAKERYMKLHAAGKTDEAKSDMERLKAIREQRAAEAARRQAEKEEKDAQDSTRKAEIEARDAKLRAAAAGKSLKKGSKKK